MAWTFNSTAVFEGELVAADSTILYDNGLYRMFYTDLTWSGTPYASDYFLQIRQATSKDGIHWTQGGITINSLSGLSYDHYEAADVFKRPDGAYVLLFSAYDLSEDPDNWAVGTLFAATSTDGVNFTPVSAEPVLTPTTGWYDNNSIHSPTVVPYNGGYLMIYTGHAYVPEEPGVTGVQLMAATSPDGINWTKHATPVLQTDPSIAWTLDGVAESSLIQAPNGEWQLYFTGLQGEERVIGVARTRGDPLTSQWTIDPDPLLVSDGQGFDNVLVIAPEVAIVDGVLRMWYTGQDSAGDYHIGYGWSDDLGGPRIHIIESATDVIDAPVGGGVDYALSLVSYTLSSDDEVEYLVTIDEAATTAINLTGNAFAQEIWGNAGPNTLKGGGGNDVLHGVDGRDTLTGDTGQDTFVFNTTPNTSLNRDTITDFSPVDDTIHLDNAIFAQLADGALSSANIRFGSAAADANDYLVYNSNIGALLYDADGNAAGGAQVIATFDGQPILTVSDFLII